MKIRALGSRVVIRPLDPEEKSPGGIHIPDVAKEKATRGKVLSVGPGKWDEKSGDFVPLLEVKVGDIVLYNKYAGREVEIDREQVLVCSVDELLGVVE